MKNKPWLKPALMIIIALLIVYTLIFHVFVLRSIQIYGSGNISIKEVCSAANLQTGMPVWKADLHQIKEVVQALGMYKVEDIRWKFPGKLCMHIETRIPVAMAVHGKELLALDDEMHVVLARTDAPNEDLMYISGIKDEKYKIGNRYPAQGEQGKESAEILRALLDSNAYIYISEIDMSDMHTPALITRSGIRVYLDGVEQYDEKMGILKMAVADLENRGVGGGKLHIISPAKADYRPVNPE